MARVSFLDKLLVIALLTLVGCDDGSDNSPSRVDLTQLTAIEAVQGMKAGDFTPSQYAEALLERAEQLEHLNAFIYLNPEEVREAAEEATQKLKNGEPVGNLIGLPLVVKDSVDTAGIPTTGGTPALVHNLPTKNAPFLQALLDQGAYVFGKTNLSEMSIDPLARNDFFGIALNPYDTSRTPGGSSSGTGVAVSARIAPLGIGEDTAGSIRLPSAWTGIVGLRPTSGRYSNAGIVPLAPHRDTPGAMARSVEDIALIDSLVTGSPVGLVPADLQGMRLGILPAYWDEVDPVVTAVAQQAVTILEEHGVIFVRMDIPELNNILAANFASDMFCSMDAAISSYIEGHGLGFDYAYLLQNFATPDLTVYMNLGVSGALPEQVCEQSLFSVRPTVQEMYAQYFAEQEVEAILMPTTAFTAPPIGESTVVVLGEDRDAFSWAVLMVEPTAFAGLPSLSIPVGLTETERLPVGLLIDGPAGEDRRVLAIGKAIEEVLPRMPPPEID